MNQLKATSLNRKWVVEVRVSREDTIGRIRGIEIWEDSRICISLKGKVRRKRVKAESDEDEEKGAINLQV
jgi:hypothetical protein